MELDTGRHRSGQGRLINCGINRALTVNSRFVQQSPRNQRKRDDDHNALMALAISEEQLTKHFAGVFSDTFRLRTH